MSKSTIAKTILAGAVAACIAVPAINAIAGSHKKAAEKCYGISKKAKNDCAGSGHSCAGQAKTSGSPTEWIYVMKGNCKRIVGGKLTSGDDKKS